jgi:Rieske Fe-S protein
MNRIRPVTVVIDMDADRGIARQIDRRTALAGAVALAGAAGLAACSSGSSGSTSPDTSANDAGGNGTTSGGGSVSLAKLDSITVGEAVSAKLDGQPVIVARPSATTAACFSAICTHMGCTVAPAGKELHCPCHGSVYSATTGKNLAGPAPRPLSKIPVKVKNGEVVANG